MGVKILQLCKKFPYPLKDGESIAINYLSKALVKLGCEITLLSMNTSKHFAEIDEIPEECSHYKAIVAIPINNDINVLDAFVNLFTSDSYHVNRFVSKDFNKELIALLKAETYDIIQLETLYLTPYITTLKKYSSAKIVMRAHNIESEIWERLTRNTPFVPKRWYLKYLTYKLKNYEQSHLNDYDLLVSVSERDLYKLKDMGYKNGAICSPIGLKINNYNPVKTNMHSCNSLCFIGAMDWIPNQEGLEWFIERVWPILIQKYPDIQLHIAGRNLSGRWLDIGTKSIVIHGEVENAADYITKHDIMIVPILSGSGMRVKILEGMALEIPIVTTSIGSEGINISHREHIMEGNTPEEFALCIMELIEKPELKSILRENARTFVEKDYDYIEIARKLLNEYNILAEAN